MSDILSQVAGMFAQEKNLGEVVETSLTAYTAQAYELDNSPPFGGLVRVKDRNNTSQIYGAVYHIATGGIDPARRATTRAMGEAGQTDEQIYDQNPQLNRLLRTEFGVLVLGCRRAQSSQIRYIFPDYPPPLHYSVTLCSEGELIEFTESPLFLRALLQASQCPVEELTAALLRRGTDARGSEGRDWLVDMGRHLARLLKEDYDRLRTILEKCEV
jgi:hypothetical protein